MSEDFLALLGYSVEGFAEFFMDHGFPDVYSDIEGADDILYLYRRDLYTNY